MVKQLPVYDRKEQRETLHAACIPAEQVYGAFDTKGAVPGSSG